MPSSTEIAEQSKNRERMGIAVGGVDGRNASPHVPTPSGPIEHGKRERGEDQVQHLKQ